MASNHHRPWLLSLLCFCPFLVSAHSASSSSSVLRGVHPHDVKYFDSDVIKCKDGSNAFSRDRANDDFCDCADGTDEPGTSACTRGKFYCRNLGSTPRFLFSSRVNDHICDCCDGSDEYDGDVNCPNTCIMGGSIAYMAEYHHTDSLPMIEVEESKWSGKLDFAQNLKDLKTLVMLQLAVIMFVLASWFLHKSRRRQ